MQLQSSGPSNTPSYIAKEQSLLSYQTHLFTLDLSIMFHFLSYLLGENQQSDTQRQYTVARKQHL